MAQRGNPLKITTGTTPKLISLLVSGTSPFCFFWLFSFCVVCHLSSFTQVSMISFCNPFFTRVLPSICLHFEKKSWSSSAVEPGLKTTLTECLDILLKTWPNFHLAAALKLYSTANVACYLSLNLEWGTHSGGLTGTQTSATSNTFQRRR